MKFNGSGDQRKMKFNASKLLRNAVVICVVAILSLSIMPMLTRFDSVIVVGEEEIQRSDIVIYYYTSETGQNIWNPYNPIMISHGFGQRSLLCEYLFYNIFWNDTFVPWLATSYEYSSDFKTLTIKIRDGVEWSDGKPFTAKDVAFTINMLKNDTGSAYPDIVSGITRAYASDDHTFVAEYKDPSPHAYSDYVVNYMLGLAIVPEHIYGPATTAGTGTIKPSAYEFVENIWTGPYKVFLQTTDFIIYKRRDDYWAAKTGFWHLPNPKWVMIKKTGDPAAALAANELDATSAGILAYSVFESIKATNPYLQWLQYLNPCPRVLYVNLDKYPLSIPEVRHALAHVINQTKLCEIAYEGRAEVAQFHQPSYKAMQKYMPYDWLETAKGNFTGVAGSPYAGQLIEYPLDPSIYDPEVSKKILEGLGFNKVGGWWTSPNGTKCEWTLLNMMVFAPTTIAATQYVGEALREFGFDVVVKSPSFAETTQACQMMQFDLCQGWLQQPVHPSNPQVFWPKFYSKAWVGLPTSISSNFYHYNNSKFDELYLEGQVTSDQDPRYIELQKEIFKLLLVDMPSIPDGQSYIVHPVNNYYWTNWPTSGDPQNPDPSLLYAWPGHFQAHAHFVELNLVSTGRGQSTTGSVEPTIWGIPTTSFYIAIAVIVIVSVSAGYLVYRRRSVYQKKRQT